MQDATLKRCFGINKKLEDCDWDYLKNLRTLKAPHEPMARLVDVLEFMRQPGREHIWILLDIKVIRTCSGHEVLAVTNTVCSAVIIPISS